jgi:hypothetical protein
MTHHKPTLAGHTQWLHHIPGPHFIGDTMHIMTQHSRRKAVVVGSKPGAVLVRWGT